MTEHKYLIRTCRPVTPQKIPQHSGIDHETPWSAGNDITIERPEGKKENKRLHESKFIDIVRDYAILLKNVELLTYL